MTSFGDSVTALTLWIRDSGQDVVWNPTTTELPTEPGDYVYLEAENAGEGGDHVSGGLIFRYQPQLTTSAASSGSQNHTAPSETGSHSGNSRTQRQVSVSQAVAQAFGWNNRDRVLAWKLSPLPKEHQASYVELAFKDIHFGRADMLRLNLSLRDQPVYVGQRITLPGSNNAKCTVKEVWAHGRKRHSAVVTFDTDVVYRSHSARVFLCLQISSEMNYFGVDGSLYYEKLLDQFLPAIFHKWQGCNHALSVVLFSRVLYEDHELPHLQHKADQLNRDHQGRPCLDVYKMVLDTHVGCDWSKLQSSLVEEIRHFERRVLLENSQRSDGGLAGRISEAHDGNVLEVINLAARTFDNAHIDQDLTRTGHSIILVTAGTCRFAVDKNLLRLTSENLVNAGVSVDTVSLCKVPLHDVPVFAFRSVDPTSAQKSGLNEQGNAHGAAKYQSRIDPPSSSGPAQPSTSLFSTKSAHKPDISRSFQKMPPGLQTVMRPVRKHRVHRTEAGPVYDPLYFDSDRDRSPTAKLKWFYCLPDWMDASFYSRQPDKPFRADRYMPRTVMQEVENLGVESDSAVISLPLLPRSKAGTGRDDAKERQLERDRLDELSCGGHIRPYKSNKPRERQAMQASALLAPPLKRQNSSGTATPKGPRVQRGRTASRAAASSSSVQTTKANSPFALTPLRSSERSPSVSSRTSRRTVSYGALTPTTSVSTATGTFTATTAMLSKITASGKTTADEPSQTPTAASWLSGLLGGKSSLSKPQISKQKAPPSVSSQAEQSLRAASPARSDQRSASATVGPIAIKKSGTKGTSEGPLSLVLGASVPSSTDSHLSSGSKPNSSALPQDQALPPIQYVVNPCNPLRNRGWPMHQIGRWGRAFDQRQIRWKILSTPASLPLYIDWVPTASELATYYDPGGYQIDIRSNTTSLFVQPQPTVEEQASAVLREMVYQRLAQGFQILQPSKGSVYVKDRISAALAKPGQIADMLQHNDFSSGKSIFMTFARHVHQLSYAAGQVTVHVFMRQNFFQRRSTNYSFMIWPKLATGFSQASCTFQYSDMDQDAYDFPTLDRLIAGVDKNDIDPFKERLRYSRTRFLVLPAPIRDRKAVTSNITDGLSPESEDEDIRLAGIIKLYTLFQSGQWNSAANFCRTNLSYCFVDAQLPSEYGIEEAQAAKAEAESRNRHSKPVLPLKSIPLGDLAVAMRNDVFGLKMQTRRWSVRSFDYTFLGSELVDWLQKIFIEVRNDRQAAISDCRLLLQKGFFRALGSDKSFLDSSSAYYQLAPDFRPSRSKNRFDSSSGKALERGQETLSGPVVVGAPEWAKPMKPDQERLTIKMSEAVIMDLEPQHKSDRPCLAQVHLDIIHNPSSPLHFQVNWMSSAFGLDELIRSLSRTLDRYGLRVVENSYRAIPEYSKATPLQKHLFIPFAVSPNAMAGPDGAESLINALLKHLNYLLGAVETEKRFQDATLVYSYRVGPVQITEWAHESGIANVAIPSDASGLLFQPNRLLCSKVTARHYSSLPSVEELFTELKEFCADDEGLRKFWNDVTAKQQQDAEETEQE